MWEGGRALWGNEGGLLVYKLDSYMTEREFHGGKTGKKLNFPFLNLSSPLLGATSEWSVKSVK